MLMTWKCEIHPTDPSLDDPRGIRCFSTAITYESGDECLGYEHVGSAIGWILLALGPHLAGEIESAYDEMKGVNILYSDNDDDSPLETT